MTAGDAHTRAAAWANAAAETHRQHDAYTEHLDVTADLLAGVLAALLAIDARLTALDETLDARLRNLEREA